MEIGSSLAMLLDLEGDVLVCEERRKREDQVLVLSFYSNVPFIDGRRRRRRRSRLDLSKFVPRVKFDAPTISTGRATASSRSSLSINAIKFHAISSIYKFSLKRRELRARRERAKWRSKQRMKVGRLIHVDLLFKV